VIFFAVPTALDCFRFPLGFASGISSTDAVFRGVKISATFDPLMQRLSKILFFDLASSSILSHLPRFSLLIIGQDSSKRERAEF
jgi:hypothetical protein